MLKCNSILGTLSILCAIHAIHPVISMARADKLNGRTPAQTDDTPACSFSLLEDDIKETATENVRAAIQHLLHDNDIDPDTCKIDISVTTKSESYTAKDEDDDKDVQGEHDYLSIKATITTKRKTVIQMSELNLFSAVGPRLITPKTDAGGEKAPDSCAIDFGKKGAAPTLLTNTRTAHSIGKLEDPSVFVKKSLF